MALHGTNSALDMGGENGVDSPRCFPIWAETLGSQFVAHPPIAPYPVEISDPSNWLVADLESFETDDELYLCEYHDIENLHFQKIPARIPEIEVFRGTKSQNQKIRIAFKNPYNLQWKRNAIPYKTEKYFIFIGNRRLNQTRFPCSIFELVSTKSDQMRTQNR